MSKDKKDSNFLRDFTEILERSIPELTPEQKKVRRVQRVLHERAIELAEEFLTIIPINIEMPEEAIKLSFETWLQHRKVVA